MGDEEKQEGREPELRKITPEELEWILANHKKWVESNGQDGVCCELAYTNLSGTIRLNRTNLVRAQLSGSNLSGAILNESNLQKANLLGANFQHSGMIGIDLQGAFLDYANLTSALLIGAKLEGASARRANFSGAIIHRATLQKANLQAANLSFASLKDSDLRDSKLLGAKLHGANISGAKLANADLRYADLTDAILLETTPLAGMDLTGTRLPADIAKFEGLANVKEAATKASHLFTILLLGCLYAWLTVGTGFMGEAKEDKLGLPFIYNAYISREGFSLAAPLFLLGLYGYLHIYLQRLWEHLALLPAIFPDGTTLDKKATPWLFVGYVRAHMPKLRALPPQPMDRMQTCLIQLAAYWLVPITLGMFWWDSLGQGSGQGALIDGLLGLTGLGLGYWFMSLAAGTLSGRIGPRATDPERFRRGLRQALADNMVEVAWFLLGVVPMFAAITFFRWPS